MFCSSLLHKSDINSQRRALPSAITDDVPGMKAVLSLLMFPNYKPFGTGRGKTQVRRWRVVMGPDPSPGSRTGRGGESVGLEERAWGWRKAPSSPRPWDRFQEGTLSPGAATQLGTAMPWPPHASPMGRRCSHCDLPSSPPVF